MIMAAESRPQSYRACGEEGLDSMTTHVPPHLWKSELFAEVENRMLHFRPLRIKNVAGITRAPVFQSCAS